MEEIYTEFLKALDDVCLMNCLGLHIFATLRGHQIPLFKKGYERVCSSYNPLVPLSEGIMEQEIDRQTGAVSAVMQTSCRSVVVKRASDGSS